MKVYIAVRNRDSAPTMMELVAYAWAEGINLSYARSGDEISDSTHVALGWAKWLDNPGWRGKAKPTEFLNLEWSNLQRVRSRVSKQFHKLSQQIGAHNVLIVDMEDSATTMDRRAFARAVYLLSECTEGLIYIPVEKQVLDAKQYYERNQELIDSEFSVALEPAQHAGRGDLGTHSATA